MNHRAAADSVNVYGDEDGWHLRVETEDGDTFDFRIHHLAWEFATNVDSEIGAERRFAESCRGTGPPRITQEDLDAYELGDPKRITLEREMNR